MKRYRILVVCGGSHVSGLEIMNLTLMKQLKEAGHSVCCLVSGWNDGAFIARLENLEIPYKSVKLGNLYLSRLLWTLATILNLPKAIFQINYLLKEYKPDIIILNDHRNFLHAGFLWNGLNLIYWEENLPAFGLFNKITFKYLHKKARAIIACSDFVKNRLEALMPGSSKIKTIHNSIETSDNIFSVQIRDFNEPIRIGIVGQIIPRKGHLMLVEAFAVLLNKNLNCAIHIYGNDQTAYAVEVSRLVNKYGLSRHVHWKGFVNDKNNIYGNLDIVVVPSVDEPFGLVALEPALWNLPVVAARSGGLPEIIEDECSGLLFNPDDFQELAIQLEKLITSPSLRDEMGRQAKIRLNQYFTAQRMTDKFIEIFDQLHKTTIQ
jgi:glycosyltransferase involved in cell wall biosynthesis